MPAPYYDPAWRTSAEGKRLYNYWRRIRQNASVDPAWNSYPAFYTWAMSAGYILGDLLIRGDEALPYGPENCYWQSPNEEENWAEEWCELWDNTVNKLRKRFGLPPLKGE
jgi:hypothetical protein